MTLKESDDMCNRKHDNERHDDLTGTIMIRSSRPGDVEQLRRLAGLECRRLPEGSFLVAEVNGEVLAAAPIDVDAEPLGDPFVRTADVRELLRVRARQIRLRYSSDVVVRRSARLLTEPA